MLLNIKELFESKGMASVIQKRVIREDALDQATIDFLIFKLKASLDTYCSFDFSDLDDYVKNNTDYAFTSICETREILEHALSELADDAFDQGYDLSYTYDTSQVACTVTIHAA